MGPQVKAFQCFAAVPCSSFSVFSFLKFLIPAHKAPPIANVTAKGFQETGPGFQGRGVSAALWFRGPEDRGKVGIAVPRGRLPKAAASEPRGRQASPARPSRSPSLSPKAWIREARDAKVGCPEAALSAGTSDSLAIKLETAGRFFSSEPLGKPRTFWGGAKKWVLRNSLGDSDHCWCLRTAIPGK